VGSVLAQTYTNWELIIWDDGSKDNTQSVIKSFAENDPRIRYYYAENHGKSYSLNKAIQKAQGDYLAFLDDDDVWYPEKLEMQLEVMHRHPNIDLLFTNFYNKNLKTGRNGIYFDEVHPVMRKLDVQELSSGIFLIRFGLPETMLITNFVLPSSVIIKKKCYETIGSFNENLRNTEDMEYWWRMGLAQYKFAYINKVLLDRNKPENSLSSISDVTYLGLIRAMDSCFKETLLSNYKDLSREFDHAYQGAWQSLIRIYAFSGERKKAVHAYKNSLKHGISFRAIYLLIGALLGEKTFRIIFEIKNKTSDLTVW